MGSKGHSIYSGGQRHACGSGVCVAAIETELEGGAGGEHERLPRPDRPKLLVLTFSMRAMLP